MWAQLKRTPCLLLFILSIGYSDDLYTLYERRQFESVINGANAIIKEGDTTPQIRLLLGRAYVETGKAEEAIPCLYDVIRQKKAVPARMYGAALFFLSKAYSRIGDLDSSRIYLSKAIATGKVKEAVADNRKDIINYGLSPVFNNWERKETENFMFYFHPKTKVKDVNAFTQSIQTGFDTINTFFNATLPKKIDFYVWNENVEYSRKDKLPSGFCQINPPIIHARYFQSRGHETAHLISYYAVKYTKKTKFINEGVAVHFDLTYRDRITLAREARTKVNTPIINMWLSDTVFNSMRGDCSYALAGAFVGFLINKEGMNAILMLLSNQTYQNALSIDGEKIDKYINEFEALIKT